MSSLYPLTHQRTSTTTVDLRPQEALCDRFVCALSDGGQPAQAQLRRHDPGVSRNLNPDFARSLAP